MHVLFVCVANAGRSVMAEYLLREIAAGRHQARSAGTEPGAAPHPRVIEALQPVTPGVRRISWEFPDPKNLHLDQVRAIRDGIRRHVAELVAELDREKAAA